MKRYGYILLGALVAILAGCSDNTDVFYSVSYPIVRIEGVVTGSDSTDNSDETSEETDGAEGTTDDGTVETATRTGDSDDAGNGGSDTATSGESENPIFAQIETEIVTQAPVQVGGGYTLDFTKYNLGRVHIDTATDAGSVTGLFFKEPGADSIRFYYLEQDYTCQCSSYTDENGSSFMLFTIDLSDQYKELYPDAGITQVIRREYTSTPY